MGSNIALSFDALSAYIPVTMEFSVSIDQQQH
jgi:hypothetical protein